MAGAGGPVPDPRGCKSLSVIVMGGEGDVELVPASFWNFENVDPGAQEGERERSWRARVTTYGPSTSYTRLLARDRLVFLRWGTSALARDTKGAVRQVMGAPHRTPPRARQNEVSAMRVPARSHRSFPIPVMLPVMAATTISSRR